MTADYISGYLNAISSVKDILTRHVGGTNQFFPIHKDKQKSLIENIKTFMTAYKANYLRYGSEEKFQETLGKIHVEEIVSWKDNLQNHIKNWTCDQTLTEINGKNGYYLSEYLINFLLLDFLPPQTRVYRLLPDWGDWHWGDHMSEEFVFETEEAIYIMHFGESS